MSTLKADGGGRALQSHTDIIAEEQGQKRIRISASYGGSET